MRSTVEMYFQWKSAAFDCMFASGSQVQASFSSRVSLEKTVAREESRRMR